MKTKFHVHKLSEKRTAGLILAAGNSSRFGGLKQLASFDGEPLLARVIRAALSSELDAVVVVLGFEAEKISGQLGDALVHPALSVVTNSAWQQGMATSLRAGMAQIDRSFDSVMVMLGDFPHLDSRIIDQVLHIFRISDRGICLPVRKGRWGHPVCLSSRYFDALLQVDGDQGAREIIKANWSDVHQLSIQDNGCFQDIDSQEDMERLRGDIKAGDRQ
jgi:molybdenum cofactor cytidylyltransferase